MVALEGQKREAHVFASEEVIFAVGCTLARAWSLTIDMRVTQ
jgi:hypothetical protein